MRRLVRIAALLLVVMLSAAATRVPASLAQDSEEAAGPFDDLTQLEGLEYAGSRWYSVDYASLMANASPESMDDIEFPEGVQYLSGMIFQFDGDDNAKAARDKAAEQIEAEGTIDEITFEEIEVDDFNDDTIALGATTDDEFLGTSRTVLIVTQEDEYLYVAIGVETGEDPDPTDTAVDLMNHMIDEDSGDDDASFNADGSSEGGIWDKFPDADDDLVEGLLTSDQQLFPEPEI